MERVIIDGISSIVSTEVKNKQLKEQDVRIGIGNTSETTHISPVTLHSKDYGVTLNSRD